MTRGPHKPRRTNESGSCLWCGRKLRKLRLGNPGPNPATAGPCWLFEGERGGYGDNAFCGLTCGHYFAVAVAIDGTRLAAEPEPEPGT